MRDKPGGGEGNRGRALTEQREVDIRALLRGQMHDQLKMSFALWTRHAVRE
ncbi:transposase [Burkholderia pseudomallei]|uniref:Transposase n=1 Tax=Burkholderia pseudomallei (strain 1106a) TaxID=357348 RepID=A3P6X8_BURP0|nr:transposase [Burkholderia pseudomallei 1106a]AJW56421.1 transposase [Burkholderia pseudomallei]EDS83638.1 putative transposase [Burkholderia pseudomallei S13]ALC60257.1 transposase [Burkholderia pseudomallei]ARL54839.1 transposase [Burkholderia pseudomallei]